MSEINVKLRHPASFMVKEDNGPDVSVDEQLIEILGCLDHGKTRFHPTFRLMLPVSFLFLSLSPGGAVPCTFLEPLTNTPIMVPSSPRLMWEPAPLCETQLPGGIHFIS